MAKVSNNDEFLKKRKARQKKIRKRRIITGFVIFLILGIITGVCISLTVLFPIKTLNISGSKRYTPEQIIAASGINKGDNLFSSTVSLEKLRESLPYIDSVKIKRKLPDTYTITLTDAVEYACYFSDNAYYTVSRKGYVLEKYAEKPEGIFEIRTNGVKCKLGREVAFEDEKGNELIGKLSSCAEKEKLKINFVDVTDNTSIKITTEGRFTVNFGTSNFLEEKFAHLASMIENIEVGKTGNINLSMWTSDTPEGTFVAGEIV